LDSLNAGRRQAAAWYRRELAGVKGVVLPPEDIGEQTESVYHKFVIRLENNDRRESLARKLKEKGIETGVHYPVPNHLQPAITDMYGPAASLPKTEDYVKRILSLPMFPALSEGEVKTVADEIKAFLVS
jgi:dTDP-4-amino-4,6-dideoxygalactose transaminase